MRSSTWIEVPELPWPLRFDFMRIEEDDGSTRWGVFGVEFGAPVPRDNDNLDPSASEITPERLRVFYDDFDRYRRMAEELLIPTPERVEAAVTTRETMRRRRRGELDDPFLIGVVAEWRTYGGRRNAQRDMAKARHVNRHTLRRWLERAKERGLLYSDG